VKIECHAQKRVSATSPNSKPDRQSTYTVASKEKCGFKPKGRGLVNNKVPFCSGITIAAIKESAHMRLVMRLKYIDEQKIIQPQRPGLFFKKSVRMQKGVYKLL